MTVETKGLPRGIDFGGADDDPFAELARIVDQPHWQWPKSERAQPEEARIAAVSSPADKARPTPQPFFDDGALAASHIAALPDESTGDFVPQQAWRPAAADSHRKPDPWAEDVVEDGWTENAVADEWDDGALDPAASELSASDEPQPFADVADPVLSTHEQAEPEAALDDLDQALANALTWDIDESAFADEIALSDEPEISAQANDRHGGAVPTAEVAAVSAREASAAPAESYSAWLRPREQEPQRSVVAAAAPGVVAAAPAAVEQKRSLEADLELALERLSAPLRPRDTHVAEAPSFAPESVASEEPKPAAAPLDDFDELIASELAMLRVPPQQVDMADEHDGERLAAVDWIADDDEVGGTGRDGTHEPLGAVQATDDGSWRTPAGRSAVRRRSPRGRYMLAASVLALVLAGGAAWSLMGPSSPIGEESPILIKADLDPVKIKPENPGGKPIPNQNKAVYDRVDGEGAPAAPVQQALLTSSEEPVEIVPEPEEVDDLPGVGMMDEDMIPMKGDERLAEDDMDSADQSAPVPVLQPRRVRTVTVRPDGTLGPAVEVGASDKPAEDATSLVASLARSPEAQQVGMINTSAPMLGGGGTAMAALEPAAAIGVPTDVTAQEATAQPQPELPTADEAAAAQIPVEAMAPGADAPMGTATNIADAPAAAADDASELLAEEMAGTSSETQIAALASGGMDASDDAALETTAPADPSPALAFVPVPRTRPGDQPLERVQMASAEPRQATAVSTPPAASTPVAAQSVPAGSYFVQIASQPSEALAQESSRKLAGQYAGVIGGRNLSIQSADIPGRGTYFRVRIAAGSQSEANTLCGQLKSAGASCFVAR
ncbi:SPOR domain-containing protein [Consotaella aegiceratis]|uniref:SPOR domain-containing protein n=1 Tax=Consotaella aegiceratis TaxID=3097961 RepID=UPI002F3F8C14